jgi:uncharacterized repeat protein (TIGR02543 family)
MVPAGAVKSSGGSFMKKRGSINKKLLYAGAICSLVSLFTACEALGPEPEPVTVSYEKAVVHIQIGNGIPGRTVMPDIAPLGIDKWKLRGGKLEDGTDTLLLEFDNVADAAVALEPGEWHFTIEGYKDGDLTLSGSIAKQTINLEEAQTLVFEVELVPVKNVGNGTVSITIKPPTESGVTSVQVRKNWVDYTIITVSGNEIVFEEDFPVGEYHFSFRLYKGDKLLGVVSEMVHVWGEKLKSAKTYTLLQKDLNLVYTIKYHIWDEAAHAWDDMDNGYYQRIAAEPLAGHPTRDDYSFKGWYANEDFSGGAVTKIPVGSTGDKDFYSKWIRTFSGSSLADALASINAGQEADDEYLIILDEDETWTTTQDLTVTGGKEIAVTIDGNGKTISLGSNGSLLTLGADPDSSLTLVLEDITLKGKDDNTASLVQVKDGATLDLKADSVLTGNTSTGNGGGVSIASGGTLTMSGGEISGNKASGISSSGGGVYVANGGKFIMNDGAISGNSTPSSGNGAYRGGGGVFVASGGEFTMNGGEVRGNSSLTDGGGIFAYGNNGKFTMNGGTISDNTATNGGGVYAGIGGTFTMTGGVIYGSEEEDDKANTATTGAAFFKYNGNSSLDTTSSTIDKRTP